VLVEDPSGGQWDAKVGRRCVVVSCGISGGVVVAASSGGVVIAALSSAALVGGFGIVVVGKIVIVASSSSVRGVVVSVVIVFIASSLSLLVGVVVIGEVKFTSALGVVSFGGGGTQRAGKWLHAVSMLLRGRRMGSGKTKLSHILRMSSVSCLRSYFGGGKPMGVYLVCRATTVGPGGSWLLVVGSSGFATAVPL